MTVTVTPDDIANGLRHRMGFCPVALALKRATGQDVRVGQGYWFVFHPHKPIRSGQLVYLSNDVTEWISQFDGHRHVRPIEFEIEDL